MKTAMLLAALTANITVTPSDAVGWAIAHQVQVPETERAWWRYVWIPQWMVPESEEYQWDERHVAAAISYVVNECASQRGILIQPRSIANGWMVACYLPSYASYDKTSRADKNRSELQVLVDTWDGLANDDPYFHLTDELSGENVAVVAPHLTESHAELLNELNVSPALVYRADWFLCQMTDDHYYDFVQMPDTQEKFYASLGADEELSKELDADQRVAMFVSDVSAKPRRIDRIQGVSGRYGTGAIWQTWDIFDDVADAEKHPFYNLLAFEPDGGEIIAERPNGLHSYLLIDFPGRNRVAEAPPNLVSDHTIPAPPDGPGTYRLRPAISCIRCHGENDGLHPAPNEVRILFESGTGIADDFSSGLSQYDTLNRLHGLYLGDFSRRLTLGRQDYGLAVRRATRMPGIPQGMGVKESSALVSRIFGNYRYRKIDARQSCIELGLDPGDNPREALRQHVPPIGADTELPIQNPVMASLMAGLQVQRADWEQVYPQGAVQASKGKE